jgi:hypothetical protein
VANRYIAALLIVTLLLQLYLSPMYVSRDLMAGIIWAENILHKSDWDFTTLDVDYKHNEQLYMSRPPGAEAYPYALLRILFGFSHIYCQLIVKLPPIIGHLIIGYVIWSQLCRMHLGKKIPFIASSLYLLNPAILIQTAYLGKPDSFALALLLLAIKNVDTNRFPIYYGLSLLSKQFSSIFAPWFLFQGNKFKNTVLAFALLILLTSPYLLHNPLLFVEKLITTHTGKSPEHLSWMTNLKGWGLDNPSEISNLLFGIFAVVVILLALTVKTDALTFGAVTFSLFIVFSKVVYEQYILWTMPFLLLAYFIKRRNSALIAYLIGSISCILSFEGSYLIPDNVVNAWNLALAMIFALTALDLLRSSWKTHAPHKRTHR